MSYRKLVLVSSRTADTSVVYKDMKVGFLADDTDHGTRELREIFKGETSHLVRHIARS